VVNEDTGRRAGENNLHTAEATSSDYRREEGCADEPEDHGYEHSIRSASGQAGIVEGET